MDDRLIEQVADELSTDRTFVERLKDRLIGLFKQEFDDSEWSGSASNWDTAEAYCRDCLIDENTGGGEKVKDKCHLPYRKPGSGKVNRNALRAMASGGRGLPALKGVSEASRKKAANWMINIWPKAFDKPAPPSIYRIAGKTPPQGDKEVALLRDKAGNLWFLGVYSNKFEDEDNEILSQAAHQEYADWTKESGFKPAIIVNHLPRVEPSFWIRVFDKFGSDPDMLNRVVELVYRDTMFARGERIVPWHGFVAVLGKVLPGKEDVARALMQGAGKMSHGFIGFDFKSDENIATIIDGYRTFEMSVLVGRNPANVLTGSMLKEGESDMFKSLTDEDRSLLADIFGAGAVEALDQKMDEGTQLLESILRSKDKPAEEEKPAEEANEGEKEESPVEPSEDKTDGGEKQKPPAEEDEEGDDMMKKAEKALDVDVKPITAEDVVRLLNVDELKQVLSKMVADLEALRADVDGLKSVASDVQEIKKSDDERIAASISPVSWKGIGAYTPSQAPDNTIEVKEKKELEMGGPAGSQAGGNDFLNAVLGALRQG